MLNATRCTTKRGLVAAGACGVLLLAAAARGDGKKIDSKLQERTRASTVNFAAELGLGFASLTGLGARIEAARDACDPAGLAAAAAELAVAEAVAEKSASVTAASIALEAAQLAKMRNIASELKAVALLSKDAAVSKDLLDLAAKAAAAEAARQAGGADRARGIGCKLFVYNQTRHVLTCFVNGVNVGQLAPYAADWVWVGQSAAQTTHLRAECAAGAATDSVSGAVCDYHWNVTD